MAETLTIRTASSTEVVKIASVGPQGPKGDKGDPGDVAGLPLSAQGDTLYRGSSQNERLAIGSTGQVLKVSAQGLPSWANESGAVTSVNGATGAVTVAAASHTHDFSEINVNGVFILGAGNNNANGAYLYSGDFGDRGAYHKDKDSLIYWDGSAWLINVNGADRYSSTQNVSWPYQVTSWSVIPGTGTAPAPNSNSRLSGQEFEEIVGQRTNPTSRGDAAGKNVGTGANDVAAGNHTHSAATQSVAGFLSTTDKTKLDGLGTASTKDAPATGNASSTQVVLGNDTRLSDARTPSSTLAHAASHASAGSDPLAPSDIGAQSIFVTDSLVLSTGAEVTLTAARAKILDVLNFSGSDVDVVLPQAGNQVGDTFVFRWASGSNQILVRGVSAGSPVISLTSGEQKRVIRGTSNWSVIPVDTHTHAASAITSGTLTHERGGLEADVSAYSGLVKISGGSTSAVGIGTGSTEVAAGDHGHGNITSDGKLGSTAGLPLVTTTAGAVTTLALGTAGQILRTKSDLSGVEFADPAAAGVTSVTGTAPIVSSGGTTPAISVTVGTGANTVAAGDDARFHTRSHAITSTSDHTAGNHKVFYSDGSGQIQELALGSSGQVLTSNGVSAAPSFAAASGGVSNVDSTLADVMSVSGSNLVADDGGLVDSSNPALVWDDAAGKAVWANPLRRTAAGAFYVGVAPTTTALGTDAINIQSGRSTATRVASGSTSIAIGNFATASGTADVAIGTGTQSVTASGSYSVAVGVSTTNHRATSTGAVALGVNCQATGGYGLAVGADAQATQASSVGIGYGAMAQAINATAIGLEVTSDLRSAFFTRPFRSVYWGGQTTTNAATVLNLDGTATNRFTIAASTALAVDILLVARRSDTADKWLVARRFLGIRRDGSNNTSLIGTVQTLGTDQSEGSPTWTFALTADDTNEALQLEVTGATGETVQWRACAIYRVV